MLTKMFWLIFGLLLMIKSNNGIYYKKRLQYESPIGTYYQFWPKSTNRNYKVYGFGSGNYALLPNYKTIVEPKRQFRPYQLFKTTKRPVFNNNYYQATLANLNSPETLSYNPVKQTNNFEDYYKFQALKEVIPPKLTYQTKTIADYQVNHDVTNYNPTTNLDDNYNNKEIIYDDNNEYTTTAPVLDHNIEITTETRPQSPPTFDYRPAFPKTTPSNNHVNPPSTKDYTKFDNNGGHYYEPVDDTVTLTVNNVKSTIPTKSLVVPHATQLTNFDRPLPLKTETSTNHRYIKPTVHPNIGYVLNDNGNRNNNGMKSLKLSKTKQRELINQHINMDDINDSNIEAQVYNRFEPMRLIKKKKNKLMEKSAQRRSIKSLKSHIPIEYIIYITERILN